MRNMIAYCGLNCEKCDAYLATILVAVFGKEIFKDGTGEIRIV